MRRRGHTVAVADGIPALAGLAMERIEATVTRAKLPPPSAPVEGETDDEREARHLRDRLAQQSALSVTVPPRPCSRCTAIAAAQVEAGHDPPPIEQAESWDRDGRRYWAALCAGCTDFEWSNRIDKLFVEAEGKKDKVDALVARVNAWQKMGRHYLGTKCPGGRVAASGATKHTPGCNCPDCRAERVAGVMAQPQQPQGAFDGLL